MDSRLAGKVALVTGAALGQGRSHAITLAGAGADIIAFDICAQIDSVRYPMGTRADLDHTVAEVEKLGRRIIAAEVDVRDGPAMRTAVADAVAATGRLDVVCANAGILPTKQDTPSALQDALNVDLSGVLNTVSACLPFLSEGSSIVLTGSTGAMIPGAVQNSGLGAGGVGYALAKKFVLEYTEAAAAVFAPLGIRVNAVHPTNVNTNLLHDEAIYKVFRPDLEEPKLDDVLAAYTTLQALPIPWVEPADVSQAVLFLASDASRYITGTNLRVDGGALLKIRHS